MARLKESFTFPLENRLQSSGEMVCEKPRAGITSEMHSRGEPQTAGACLFAGVNILFRCDKAPIDKISVLSH